MRVTKKQVWRFFTDGKGFANATLAYRHIAKRELGHILESRIIEMHGGSQFNVWDLNDDEERISVRKAMAEMFPPDPEKGEWASRDKRRKWIENRIEELRKEDGA